MTVRVESLAGEVDLATAPSLAERFADAREAGESIVVDLEDCTFLDLHAVAAVVAGYRASKALGLPYVVALPPTAPSGVRFLLLEAPPDRSGLPLYPSLASARTAVSKPLRAASEPVDVARFHAARSETWRLLREQSELIADRDRLLIQVRAARVATRAALTSD